MAFASLLSIIMFLLPQITIIAARYSIDKTERYPPPLKDRLVRTPGLRMTEIINPAIKRRLETAITEFFHTYGRREGIRLEKGMKCYFETGNMVELQHLRGARGTFERVFDPPFNPTIPAQIQEALNVRISKDGATLQSYQLFVTLSRSEERHAELVFGYEWFKPGNADLDTSNQIPRPGARVIFGRYNGMDSDQIPELFDNTVVAGMQWSSSEDGREPSLHRTSTAGLDALPSSGPRLGAFPSSGPDALPPGGPSLGGGSARGEFNNYYYNYINDYINDYEDEFDMDDIYDLMYEIYLSGYREGKRAKNLKQNRLLNRGYR